MSISLYQYRALAIISLLLVACAPTDRPDNQAGYTLLNANPGHSTPSRSSVEIVEFFMYSCGHCYAFDEPLNAWLQKRPAIHFQRVPIAFSARDVPLQRLYYAVQTLPNPAQLHRSIFAAIHQQKRPLDSESEITDYMVQLGIERAAFLAAYHAPAVQQQIDHVLALRHRYAIRAVPTIIVADRFLTSPAMVQGSSLAADTSQPIEHATIRMLDYLLAQAETAITPPPGDHQAQP
ncbi:thiol:disulfide interchange protein DsbA/DsbL [Janthinobacterium sp. UMAB-60]|uniref:thiol:disulfide interchange protein DsbA/DsbL n=1 Tax=Janthinobacterium sp. UMAB-60 TaxID=1365365 RepID=UPI001C5808BE|nr:thiol:disulfide interchange protein DsbA/DsbL [Janthinobacterium sp. UMAB-60]